MSQVLPKIIKTIFYVDPSHNRNYSFDVNADITFSDLKNILVAAANVNRLGLRIFHKQSEKELTQLKLETLEETFPKKDLIEFIIQIDRSSKVQQEHENLKLGTTCTVHPNKYCIFYCFDCERSLCSLCIGSGQHQNHALSEKFDYLKPSNEIVNTLFSDMDDVVNKVASTNHANEINEYKAKLTMEYFPSLIELLKKIEAKLNSQIDNFNKHCTVSIKTVKENSIKLKEHCTEGLNELKYQIDIENMLRDEGVFLHFDYKVKEMSNEKQRIIDDTEKLQKIIQSFTCIKSKLETIYIEIKTFLEQYLDKATIYDEVNKHLSDLNVDVISKDNIIHKLLSEFKKQNGRIISEAKNKRNSNSNFITKALGSTVFNLNSAINQSANPITQFSTVNNTVSSNNITNDEINNSGVQGGHETADKLNQSNSKAKNNSASKDQTFISDHNIFMEIDKSNIDKYTWIINPKESENKIVIFVESQNNANNKVFERSVKFNPSTHGISNFLKNMATVNTGKVVYISGGEISLGQGCDLFFEYKPTIHSLQRKEDMLEKKHSHSIIYFNDYVYSIGGYSTSSCERYDTKTSKWVKLSNLIAEERIKPLLYIQGTSLFAFFGFSQGNYLNSIEKLNIRSSKSKWEVVPYKNNDNIDAGRISPAIIPSGKDSIYIIGGKNSQILSDILCFNFSKNLLSLNEFSLEEPSYFKESNFFKFQDGSHGLFNENLNQLLKLDLEIE